MAPLTTLKSDHRQTVHEIIICAAGVASTADSTHQLRVLCPVHLSCTTLDRAVLVPLPLASPTHAQCMNPPTYIHTYTPLTIRDVTVHTYVCPYVCTYVCAHVHNTLTNCLYISNLHELNFHLQSKMSLYKYMGSEQHII